MMSILARPAEQEVALIQIVEGLEIPESELLFAVSRSGGPGGQNVNKVSTRVTLRFAVDSSAVLSAEQRRRIHSKLESRINKDGVLQVTSQRTRRQDLNRADALDRFAELLRRALHREPVRIPTNVSRAAKRQRVEEKKKRTAIKQSRTRQGWEE
jgi:ribosome-associated protein